MRSNSVSAASAKASSMDRAWVAMTMRWRLYRSATTPPMGDNRNTGIWLAKFTDPSSADEPVSRYTRQDCATVCIHVPIREMSWPKKNRRKFRCRRARTVARNRDSSVLVSAMKRAPRRELSSILPEFGATRLESHSDAFRRPGTARRAYNHNHQADE